MKICENNGIILYPIIIGTVLFYEVHDYKTGNIKGVFKELPKEDLIVFSISKDIENNKSCLLLDTF